MHQDDLDFSAAETPHPRTAPCGRFFAESTGLLQFMGFVSALTLLAEGLDLAELRRRNEAGQLAGSAELNAGAIDVLEASGGAQAVLTHHRQRLFQMVMVQGVDNFLTYLSELLGLLFRTRPEIMRSGKTEQWGTILEFSTMEELVGHLAERFVNDLSYNGMRDLSDEFLDRWGFRLFSSPSVLGEAVRIVESRNVIVHDRAVVNRLYKSHVSTTTLEIGDTIELTYDGIWRDLLLMARWAKDIDAQAVEKWALPVEP